MPTRRTVLIAAAAAASAPAAALGDPRASQTVARLVSAMGGREAWARAKGLVIFARHWEPEFAAPYENKIFMAFDEPRMRFEGRSKEWTRIRAIVGQAGWRHSDTAPQSPMTPEQVKGDLDWWEAHVYRNVRRLAVGDPSITPRLGADGRLELYRPDGSRLMWYRLNAAGEPMIFGVGANETGTVLGPLEPRAGGVKLPVFSARHDGIFRVLITSAQALPSAPQVDYARP